MKRFILAPDSFKGTMEATEICEIWERAIVKHIPDASIKKLPIADGGEGMVASYLNIFGGDRITAAVSGPFKEPVEAVYGILPDGSAVMEMAACAGLPLVGNNPDPLRATTNGVGEMILHAVNMGVTRILLGIGGSATNDCGIGMAAALGYNFLDHEGNILEPLALNMQKIKKIVRPKALPKVSVTVACDVDNPLYGPDGATYTFGMQKGAQGDALAMLDEGLKNVAQAIKRDLGEDVALLKGAGAAGGLGAGLVAFLGAKLESGIETLLKAARFDEMLRETDCVFTGEGRIDGQSIHGKAPVGIAMHAKAANVPCIALCGSIGDNAQAVYDFGITAIFSSVRGPGDFESIKKTSKADTEILMDAVVRILSLKAGH